MSKVRELLRIRLGKCQSSQYPLNITEEEFEIIREANIADLLVQMKFIDYLDVKLAYRLGGRDLVLKLPLKDPRRQFGLFMEYPDCIGHFMDNLQEDLSDVDWTRYSKTSYKSLVVVMAHPNARLVLRECSPPARVGGSKAHTILYGWQKFDPPKSLEDYAIQKLIETRDPLLFALYPDASKIKVINAGVMALNIKLDLPRELLEHVCIVMFDFQARIQHILPQAARLPFKRILTADQRAQAQYYHEFMHKWDVPK
jgi:hypothetical protein